MFTFTQDGYTVEAATVADRATQPFTPTDVRHLPLWIAAAQAADEAGYCPVYDEIASTVGGPTREDLRDAGLLQRNFQVVFERTVPVTIIVSQQVTQTVSAANMAEARSAFEDGNVDIDWPDLNDYYAVRDAQDRYGDIEVNDDDEEVTVARVYVD